MHSKSKLSKAIIILMSSVAGGIGLIKILQHCKNKKDLNAEEQGKINKMEKELKSHLGILKKLKSKVDQLKEDDSEKLGKIKEAIDTIREKATPNISFAKKMASKHLTPEEKEEAKEEVNNVTEATLLEYADDILVESTDDYDDIIIENFFAMIRGEDSPIITEAAGDSVIDSVSKRISAGLSESEAIKHIKSVANWLKKKQFLSPEGKKDLSTITKDTAIKRSMLTKKGNGFLKVIYKKYLKKTKNGKNPNTKLLDKTHDILVKFGLNFGASTEELQRQARAAHQQLIDQQAHQQAIQTHMDNHEMHQQAHQQAMQIHQQNVMLGTGMMF